MDFISSAAATAIAELVTLPICTLKTRHQNTESISVSHTMKTMFKDEGIKAFYRASGPAIAAQTFSTASKWHIYNLFNNNPEYSLFSPQHKDANRIVNSLIAGISTSLVTHPIDFVRVHIQMNQSKPVAQQLYRGYSKSFGKVCLGSILFFPLYDNIKDKTNNPLISSFSTAILSTILIHPLDYLKTRHIYGLPLYEQKWKFSSYYKGVSLNLMRIVPHYTITMTLTNLFTTKWKEINV